MTIENRVKQMRWVIGHLGRILDLVKEEYSAELERDRQRCIDEQVEIIRQSKFFDADWYLRNHIELQNLDIDPARDYLLNGLPWHNPSGIFCNLEYWHLHPDVCKAGTNPLLHYETCGRAKGAKIYLRELSDNVCDNAINVEGHPVIDLDEHRRSFAAKESAIRNRAERGEQIRVVFLVSNVPMFSLKPLFDCMLKDDLFNPRIVVIPDFRKGETYETEMEQCKAELLEAGCPSNSVALAQSGGVFDWEDVCVDADIVGYDLPYYNITSFRYTPFYSVGRDFLPIMANYTYPQCLYDRKFLALDLYGYLWKAFFECEDTLNEYKECSRIGGLNASLTGYIKMDPLANCEKRDNGRKTILVALHHSIDGGANDGLGTANFIRHLDYFRNLPDKYPDLDFIYRPHPFLFDTLKAAANWSEDEVRAFIDHMEEKPNFSWNIGGEYLHAFAQSDACIHDCGSFLVEYLYTGNPCCYMLKDRADKEGKFTPLGQACLDQYYIAYDTDSIDRFIVDTVINASDKKASARRNFAKRVMLNYPHAADAALEDIKRSLLNPA